MFLWSFCWVIWTCPFRKLRWTLNMMVWNCLFLVHVSSKGGMGMGIPIKGYLLFLWTGHAMTRGWQCIMISGWWFQIFFIFTPIWGRFPIWLIFFRWVETTNQLYVMTSRGETSNSEASTSLESFWRLLPSLQVRFWTKRCKRFPRLSAVGWWFGLVDLDL